MIHEKKTGLVIKLFVTNILLLCFINEYLPFIFHTCILLPKDISGQKQTLPHSLYSVQQNAFWETCMAFRALWNKTVIT